MEDRKIKTNQTEEEKKNHAFDEVEKFIDKICDEIKQNRKAKS